MAGFYATESSSLFYHNVVKCSLISPKKDQAGAVSGARRGRKRKQTYVDLSVVQSMLTCMYYRTQLFRYIFWGPGFMKPGGPWARRFPACLFPL